MHTDGRSNVYCKRTKNLFIEDATVTGMSLLGFYVQRVWHHPFIAQSKESMLRENELETSCGGGRGVDGGEKNRKVCLHVGQLPALAAVSLRWPLDDVGCAANKWEVGEILESLVWLSEVFALRAASGGVPLVVFACGVKRGF